MDSFLSSLQKSYLLVPISIFMGILIAYIDNKLTSADDDSSNVNYTKLSLLIGVIVTIIIYIHNIKYKFVEEVLTNTPPF